jgi:ATP-dependent Clp protease ATP-binding subunit ClpB
MVSAGRARPAMTTTTSKKPISASSGGRSGGPSFLGGSGVATRATPAPLRLQQRRGVSARAVEGGAGQKKISQNEFTERAWEAIVLAPEIASNASQQIVETEHLCKALFEQKDSFALRIITQAGADPAAAVAFIDSFIAR